MACVPRAVAMVGRLAIREEVQARLATRAMRVTAAMAVAMAAAVRESLPVAAMADSPVVAAALDGPTAVPVLQVPVALAAVAAAVRCAIAMAMRKPLADSEDHSAAAAVTVRELPRRIAERVAVAAVVQAWAVPCSCARAARPVWPTARSAATRRNVAWAGAAAAMALPEATV